MKKNVCIVSGWAHGLKAIQPMGEVLSTQFDVRLLTGAQILKDRAIPDADCIVTGSMGGLLAMELLPECCGKLALISSTARFCADKNYPCGPHERILQRMLFRLRHSPETVLSEFFEKAYCPYRKSTQHIQLHSGEIEDPADLASGLEYLLNSDLRAVVPTLNIPILLLHGTEDRIIPPAASEWLHQHLPNSRLLIFKRAGHALTAHRFNDVMKEIMRFLASP